MDQQFGLSELPRELQNFTGGKTVPYRRLYTSVLNGALPASRSKSGRWMIDRSDLPKIASTLGLKEGN